MFGEIFTQIRATPTGDLRYIDFVTPGVLGQSVLFISIFCGMAIIWERDLGIVQKFLLRAPRRAPLWWQEKPCPRDCGVCPKRLSSTCSQLLSA